MVYGRHFRRPHEILPLYMLKRTPLFELHKESGGKLVEFGGWEMPVQYTSIMDEHQAVRNAAGIFDISHMGEVRVSGPGAGAFLNYLLTNDTRKLRIGLGQYTLMCNEQGGAVDDLYVYQVGAAEYLLVINASRIDPDVQWMKEKLAASAFAAQVSIENQSDQTGAVAIQGPAVARFIDSLVSGPDKLTGLPNASALKKNEIGRFQFGDIKVWVSRTGYTGEDGFEVLTPAARIGDVWRAAMKTGQAHGLKPAGLGARDTLRTEVCYPLYGHELDMEHGPFDAGLMFFVSLDKGDFVGREAITQKKAQGASRKLVAFKNVEKSAPPRPGYPIFSEAQGGVEVGNTVSGTLSPSLSNGIGMAYVEAAMAVPDKQLFIETRGRRAPVILCKKPLFRKNI